MLDFGTETVGYTGADVSSAYIFKNFVSIVLNELRMLINMLILLSKYCFCCFNKFIEDNNLECLELKLGSV